MSVAVDVTIGVVFLYLLLALVVTTLQELIATVFAFRANSLYDALKELILGWFLTALAVSLGSGFWFDILSKVLQLRGSGKKVSPVTGRVE